MRCPSLYSTEQVGVHCRGHVEKRSVEAMLDAAPDRPAARPHPPCHRRAPGCSWRALMCTLTCTPGLPARRVACWESGLLPQGPARPRTPGHGPARPHTPPRAAAGRARHLRARQATCRLLHMSQASCTLYLHACVYSCGLQCPACMCQTSMFWILSSFLLLHLPQIFDHMEGDAKINIVDVLALNSLEDKIGSRLLTLKQHNIKIGSP